jgi:hypothetical protein
MDINDILSEAWRLLFDNYLLIVAVVSLANLPLFIWQALALEQPSQWVAPARYRSAYDLRTLVDLVSIIANGKWNAALIIGALLSALTVLVQSASIVQVAAQRYLNNPAAALPALARTLARCDALLLGLGLPALLLACTSLLNTFGTDGTVAFIVVAALVLVTCAFVVPALVLEGHTGPGALRRSIALTQAFFSRAITGWFSIELVMVFLLFVPSYAAGLIQVSVGGETQRLVNIAITNFVAFFIEPYRDIAFTLLFFELRRKYERRQVWEQQYPKG